MESSSKNDCNAVVLPTHKSPMFSANGDTIQCCFSAVGLTTTHSIRQESPDASADWIKPWLGNPTILKEVV